MTVISGRPRPQLSVVIVGFFIGALFAALSFRPAIAQWLGDQAVPRLTEAIDRFDAIASAGGWTPLPNGPTLEAGDTGSDIQRLRERLEITADLAAIARDPTLFDADVTAAVRLFQRRHGLKIDGIVGPETRAALNVPVEDRIAALRLNLDRARQAIVPGNTRIEINVPAFELAAVRDGATVLRSRVIVGRARTRTPELQGLISRIVLNPFWTIPRSIIVNEMLPRIRKDPGYLARRSIRVFSHWTPGAPELDPGRVDWGRTEARGFKFRQDPGPQNALGKIKFQFDNVHGVYLHDTPARNLFDRPSRAFSHGCMRLENPLQLADFLLDGDPLWQPTGIVRDIDSGRNQTISLATPVPLHVVYRTAWVDDAARVHFRKDIYGRDRDALAQSSATRPKPAALRVLVKIEGDRQGRCLTWINAQPEVSADTLPTSTIRRIGRTPMADFVMLTRLTHGALTSPSSLETLEREVMERVRAECPDVAWKLSYAVLGPYDYLDIFSAPDIDTATKVATLVRTFGHATTEVWGATEWQRFKELVRYLPPAKIGDVAA